MNPLNELWLGIGYGTIPIIGYLIWSYYPPKKISRWYGYRTTMSMRNIDTWQEANTYVAGFFVPVGLLTIVFSIASYLLFPSYTIAISRGFIFLAISLIVVIVITELHLHKEFDKEGKRK